MSSARIAPIGKPNGWTLHILTPMAKPTRITRKFKWYLELIGFLVEMFTANKTYITRHYE